MKHNRDKISKQYLISEYVENKLSCHKISKKLGCSAGKVLRYLKLYNIPLTSKKDYLMVDRTGQVFNELTVVGIGSKTKKSGNIYWICRCSCGNTVEISGDNLLNAKACGLCPASTNFKGVGELSSKYFSSLKFGAKQRNLEFNITKQELWDLFIKQDRKCALTGLDLNLNDRRCSKLLKTASLDRIDSSKGYIKNNIQWIHKDINRMKQHYSEKDFIYYCNLVSNYKTR